MKINRAEKVLTERKINGFINCVSVPCKRSQTGLKALLKVFSCISKFDILVSESSHVIICGTEYCN